MTRNTSSKQGESLLKIVMKDVKQPMIAVGIFSFFISLLMLTLPIYMMQLFDRVLSSRSESTLIMLTIIAVGLLGVMGILEAVRSRVLGRLSSYLDEKLTARTFEAMFRENIEKPSGSQGLNDLDSIRNFFTGSAPIAFFDAPFIPLFMLVIFMLHPVLGIMALVGTGIICMLGLAAEIASRPLLNDGSFQSRKASMFAETSLRNAEALAAMGMVGRIRARWLENRDKALDYNALAADRLGRINSAMKSGSFIIQTILVGTACFFALEGIISAGAMIAANILMMRMIMPVQMAVSSWRSVVAARGSYRRLNHLLQRHQERSSNKVKLPKPQGFLDVENVVAAPPGAEVMTLKNVSLTMEPGDGLGIIGPSGAGKSTLARLLVGIWATRTGSVRLDGADVYSWDHEELGQYIGYLPQDVELFDGSIADNICRFGERDDDAIVEAAKRAGVHERILHQPEGYNTMISSQGGLLSGGQRQWIGLARALYGDPSLVVLDEPNANLDQAGEHALAEALVDLRQRGKTVVVIAHNPRTIQGMNLLLYLKDGRAAAFGPKDEVLPKLTQVAAQNGGKADNADNDNKVKRLVTA